MGPDAKASCKQVLPFPALILGVQVLSTSCQKAASSNPTCHGDKQANSQLMYQNQQGAKLHMESMQKPHKLPGSRLHPNCHGDKQAMSQLMLPNRQGAKLHNGSIRTNNRTSCQEASLPAEETAAHTAEPNPTCHGDKQDVSQLTLQS
jgi:hypothetical protein